MFRHFNFTEMPDSQTSKVVCLYIGWVGTVMFQSNFGMVTECEVRRAAVQGLHLPQIISRPIAVFQGGVGFVLSPRPSPRWEVSSHMLVTWFFLILLSDFPSNRWDNQDAVASLIQLLKYLFTDLILELTIILWPASKVAVFFSW